MIRFLQTPGPVKKILLGGLLLIICVMMVVTLIPGGILGDALAGGTAGTVAKVGSEHVTVQDVQQLARQMGRQQFPRGLPQQLMPFMMQRAAETLIMQNVVLAEADRMGLSASDEELRYELQHGPISREIFPNGNFIGQDAYQSFVQNQFQLSVAQFEQLVKKDLTIRKLRSVIEGGVTVSNAELMDEYRRQNMKVKFEYAVLSLDDVAKSVTPTESELRAYYEKNQESLKNAIPEQRKAAFVMIDATKLPNAAKPTNEDFKSYYQAHQDEFRVPDSVTVRHILIKTPEAGPDAKVDQAAVDGARAKAEDVLKQLKAGAKFDALAKKYSDDKGSAAEGGLLGPITRGRTVPEFEQAAFSLNKGETSGIVKSSYGFHIIRVDDKTSAHLQSLDEVRARIEPIVARQKAQAEVDKLARTLETESRAQGLEKAAAARGLQITTTEFVSREASLPGVGNAPEFMEAIFANKPMSPPVSVRVPEGIAIAQTLDVRPPATPTFEQVRDRLAQQFKQERSQAMLQQKSQELADRARSEHNLKSAAKALGATVKSSDLVTAAQQVPDVGAMSGQASIIFDAKPGEIVGPVAGGQSGIVMQLVEKQEPPAAEFEKSKEEMRESLLARKRGEVMELYVTNLRQSMEKDGKIKLNQKELARLTTSSGTND
ncbi:MAG TPA: peptidyl-prolyl cis-trans isomerase [Clostridia bacterium]|nr:peptidyl-prolyl cis-trans isomerase [Clostridia bacterium]